MDGFYKQYANGNQRKACIPEPHLEEALLLPQSEALGSWHGRSHLSTLTH